MRNIDTSLIRTTVQETVPIEENPGSKSDDQKDTGC